MRAAAALLLGVVACGKKQAPISYEAVPVERRNIIVSASASGAIEPVLTVDVKSKASGEIIGMNVQTGDDVKENQLLASIDPRIPRNNLAQAEANLAVAQAQLANAKAQQARSDTLFKAQAITQTEYRNARLDYANANAAVIREIGRASCRERGEISVVAVSLKKKKLKYRVVSRSHTAVNPGNN